MIYWHYVFSLLIFYPSPCITSGGVFYSSLHSLYVEENDIFYWYYVVVDPYVASTLIF